MITKFVKTLWDGSINIVELECEVTTPNCHSIFPRCQKCHEELRTKACEKKCPPIHAIKQPLEKPNKLWYWENQCH